ncbi:MAG: creatininase family protein [Moraxellaceae bacterium]|nr:creatininase family protein [Moraxellaceae bacterium]
MKLKSHWWWDLTTHDFNQTDMSRIVAVLPVGAVEQHGPHLPVRVDAAIIDGVMQHAVARMADDFPVLVLPTQSVGTSNEHLAFPGTLTISPQTLERLWYEICESVYRAGVRKIVLVNAHGGQPQVMDIVCRKLRIELGMFAVAAQWYGFTQIGDLFDAHELKHGIHAGEVETSMLRYLHGDLVAMERAENFESLSARLAQQYELLAPEGGACGFGWQMQDLNPKGAAGNAAAADAERGRVVVERAAERLNVLLAEVARYPLDQMVATPHPSVAPRKE